MTTRGEEPPSTDHDRGFHALILQRMDGQDRVLARIDRHVTGGDDPHSGLNQRVAMIENDRERQVWWTRAAIVAGLASAGAAIKGFFVNGGH